MKSASEEVAVMIKWQQLEGRDSLQKDLEENFQRIL